MQAGIVCHCGTSDMRKELMVLQIRRNDLFMKISPAISTSSLDRYPVCQGAWDLLGTCRLLYIVNVVEVVEATPENHPDKAEALSNLRSMLKN